MRPDHAARSNWIPAGCARFQLGMMHFTSGKAFEAEAVWSPLDRLDDKRPLRLFKSGMLRLAKDDFEGCVRTLETGIANCPVASLTAEMQRVIEKVNALPRRNA